MLMLQPTKELSRGKLRLILDKKEVFPEDPGQGTPAMLSKLIYGKEYTATYWCGRDTGELDGDRHGMLRLTDAEIEWLYKVEREVELFLYGK
jgi:hypothetical protein